MDWQPSLTAQGWWDIVGDAHYVLEVGCNDGRDTGMLMQAFPHALFHCWEPDARARERFEECFYRDPRIELYPSAVADIDGQLPWYASHGNMGDDENADEFPLPVRLDWDLSGSIMPPTGHCLVPKWIKFEEEGMVAVVRLDTWLKDHPEVETIDLLWADIQGAEARMIQGAQKVLQRTRFLYLEVYDLALTPNHHAPPKLYEGQPSFRDLVRLLPDWEVVGGYNKDAVLWKHR